MYCDYFAFSEKPFSITPNPQFMYLAECHREAIAHLLYGITNHAGFISLTGEVGTGKTLVIRSLLAQLDHEQYRSALVVNPRLTGAELLTCICRELGMKVARKSALQQSEALNAYLLEQSAASRTVVLVIDEAQNLAMDVLEELRLISNLETERDKLIQIILVGQPELNEKLNCHELRQLNQRITVRSELSPLNFADASSYIIHRLRIVGCRIPGLFPPATVKKIYRHTQGVPRLINVICDQCLVLAWTRESLVITPIMVQNVIDKNSFQRPGQRGMMKHILHLFGRA